MKKILFLMMTLLLGNPFANAQGEDSFQWLEGVDDARALEWVQTQNKTTFDVLMAQKSYKDIYDKSLAIYNSSERIAMPSIEGSFIYNFWQDSQYERGIWRRCTRDSYLSGSPQWEILLNLDEMSKKDGIKWVFKGASGLYPDYNLYMISLSKGGGDAVVQREFDTRTKSFVKGGFELPESKGGVSWLNKNTLVVGVDFGEGTMTTSGYPRQVKLWKRGTPLSSAKLIYEGDATDVGTWGSVLNEDGKSYLVVTQAITFFTSHYYMMHKGKMVRLNIPEDAELSGLLHDQILIQLKSNWSHGKQNYQQGSLVSTSLKSLLSGFFTLKVVADAGERTSIEGTTTTRDYLLVNMLNNVKSELYRYQWEDGNWISTKVPTPELGTISVVSTDDRSDDYFFTYQGFLKPSTLYRADAKANTVQSVKSMPAYFDESKYQVWQYEVASKDGVMVPYFVVGSKNISYNGQNPTLLYAYGGFGISMAPNYSGVMGAAWLDNGGVYVLANIRGGGEFGPKWHQAGLKEKRQTVYNDFHAVAESLIEKKITSPEHLGIMGGSNGGLLMGVAFTQRPDLYKAVVCAVPLLDMQRYNKLLAGASWMGEYGNPDIPEEWDYIKRYSPYHNLKAGTKYPEVYFTTSTRDDRVHPGHARKMVAKMQDMGYKVYYYENTEGGHAGASTNDQRAKGAALQFSYLLMKLKSM